MKVLKVLKVREKSESSGVWRLVAGGDYHYWVMKVPKFRGGSRGRVLVASGRVSWRKAECGRVVPKRPIVIAEWLIHHLGWNESVLES